MDRFLQAAALAMVGAVLALVVQKQAKEISILMVIACSAVILALAAWFLEPVVDFVTELRLLGQLDGATVTILLKTAGVGLLAEPLYLALPLFTSVLDMIGDMLKR